MQNNKTLLAVNNQNQIDEARATWRREEAERERARESQREWRRERKEYTEYWSKREVGDLSAADEFAKEFDEKFGPGPSQTRGAAPIASTVTSSDGGQWTALPLQLLHSLVGGDCDGTQILAPGPGHSVWDRSMCVQPSTQNIDGFVVHSFSPRTSDMECKQYITLLYECYLYEKLKDAPDTHVTPPSMQNIPLSWIESARAIQSGSQPQQSSGTIRNTEERIESAKRQWNYALKTPIGESVYDYLHSRALELPEEIANRTVCYKQDGWWYEPKGDCVDKNGLRYSISEVMLLACRDVLTDEGRAVQFVRLPHIGKGPERKVKGLVKNAAIKLTPHKDVIAAGEVAIAEGFESALAAMMLGYKNVWACVTSGNVEIFPVIPGVRKLTILGENCEANKKAREICALRRHDAGCEVVIAMPEHGKDFNDDLVELTLRKAGVA